MSYSSLSLPSKLFQLTSLTLALALAGCGGGDGDTVDSIAPEPDLGVQPGTGTGGNDNGGNNNGGNDNGGEQTPAEDFSLQKLYTDPTNIKLTDEPVTFNVTVKAVAKSGGAAINRSVSLSVDDSTNTGVTIQGASVQSTDDKGEATYELKLNPLVLDEEQKADLIENGFGLKAVAKQSSDGSEITQVTTVRVSKEGSGDGGQAAIVSKLNIENNLQTTSVSNNKLNPYGDTAKFNVIVKNTDGARVKDVTVGMGIADIKGIAIVGGNNKTTDTNGIAAFNVKIDENLTKAERDKLLRGVAYAINIKEKNGATKKKEGTLSVAIPVSDYKLAISGNSNAINAYGEKQTLTINASPANNKVPTKINEAKVSIKLNKTIEGVSLSTETLTLDAKGQAVVDIVVAPTLTAAERKALAKDGISYTVTLSEPNHSVTVAKDKSGVEIPAAKYDISFNDSSKKQLSSSGDSAIISFRVNDKNGGTVSDQTVKASLSDALTQKGLLTIDGSSEKETNANGMVSYTVVVPAGLTDSQKTELESIEKFILSATIFESSGASSKVVSEAISIGSDIGKSDIQLSVESLPATVSALAEQFKLRVAGKRKNGSAAADRKVKLVLDEKTSTGITIIGNELITDSNGVAEFSLGISKSLTAPQREKLIKSGILYTAVLTDNDGTQSKISQKIKVEQPATSIQFSTITSPTISELGGSGFVNVRLTDKQEPNQPIKNKEVSIQLGKKAQDYGVTLDKVSNSTDFNGETTFKITIPEGLTTAQRTDLKAAGINYQLSYVESGIKYDSVIKKVAISKPKVVLNILNSSNQATYKLNNVGDNKVIQAQLNNQTDKTLIGGQAVSLVFDNNKLAQLLTVNGQLGSANIKADTDDNGVVSFDIVVPSNLTDDEKEALKGKSLTATLTESVTGKTQKVTVEVQSMTAAVLLSSTQSEPLNLNGGETQITVIAQDKDNNIVTGQKVFLALPATVASKGVTLVSGSQTTDNSGKAVFTIAVPNNLTEDQKKAIGNSFDIVLSAADASGNIVTKSATVSTETPDLNGTKENLTIGANKVVNTKGDSFKVFVRVADKDSAVKGREVRLNVDEPIKTGVSITNGTATTNSDGVATFDLKLESGANVDQALLEKGIKLTATTTTAKNTKLEQSYIVAVDTATIDNYQILVTSDKSTLTTGGDQTNATFRVTDSNGGILAGVPVQLSIANLAASGAALTTPSMVTTDANGQIDVGILLAANNINARLNHAIDIEAKITTPVYDAKGDVTLEVRERKTLSLSAIGTIIDITASETKLKDGQATTISTTLIDGAGQAIANAEMELVNADGIIIAPTATATTNADGQAVFELSEDKLTFDSNGNLQVYARAFGENKINDQRSISSIDLIKVSQAGISFINIEDTYDVNEPQEIQIQIRADSAEQAAKLVGKAVEVQTTIGSLIPNYLDKFTDKVIVSKPIKTSDIKDNVITVKVWLKSGLAGTTVLQATILGENVNGQPKYQVTADTRFRATTPAKMLFQTVKSVITPGSSTEVVATVKDKNDVPVEGQTVVFSRASDSSAGRLSAATAITDRRGEARVVYTANASSPIGGVVINGRLLNDSANIGTKTTNITVSEEAVYTTLAFANKLSSDDIYYTVRGSISVMDGSGRAVPNKEVSIKSYAIEYAQGKVCLLDSTTTYQAADEIERDDKGDIIKVTTPERKVFSEQSPNFLQSGWKPTEDSNYNYTLDKDNDPILNEDKNGNDSLDAINPVAIIGGTLSDDGYTFVTDDEGRADFEIRYPMRYSNWVKVRFDATTFLNGSESTQSINYQLPSAESDLIINGSNIQTPWIDNTSPFGHGGAVCTSSMNVKIDDQNDTTQVVLSPYQPNQPGYFVSIDGVNSNSSSIAYNSFIVDFNQAFDEGSRISVRRNGFEFSKTIMFK